MCGIAGKIARGSIEPDLLDPDSLASRAIRARGPDNCGSKAFHCYGYTVALAHSRLSIIDLSEQGRQPMHERVSGWWISYNGELYNYLELRKELNRLGWAFQSDSDTEVLLKAWAQWGIGALARFNGMFALALFHPGKGELWLVRDRFGVKPLTWARLPDDGLVFSSSVASVARQAGDEIDIDYCGRGLRYKVYETAQSGSPFKRVQTIPAGGWVRIRLGERKTDIDRGQWYDLTRRVAERTASIEGKHELELLEQCHALLEDAVRLRLRSDVPVAVSLSGGLDSSAIAALASRRSRKIEGITYGSPYAQTSEGPDVQVFSKAVGIHVNYIWPRFDASGLGAALERTMRFQEAPFSGLSLIAQNEVFRGARGAGFRVLLGGQGGDESFAGYRKFFVVALREALHKRQPLLALHMLWSLGLMLVHEAGQARMYWENLDRYRNRKDAGLRLIDWNPAPENLWGAEHAGLSARQVDDVRQWSLPTLLRYEDRNSMGHGIESRLPFMDYRLVELALALPAQMKIGNGFGKWALRRVTASRVPDHIRLNRKKRGFDVTQAWVKEGIGESLRARVFDQRRALSVYLRPDADLDALLSDAALAGDPNLLDEALMLAWLAEPVRPPVTGALRQARYA